MIATILEAKARLEREGLHVSRNDDRSLWIAAKVSDGGDGVRLSNDACGLFWDVNRWVAVFPADGLLTYEVPGDLEKLTSLIAVVYGQYRRTETPLNDIVKQVVDDAEQYLVGRPLTRT